MGISSAKAALAGSTLLLHGAETVVDQLTDFISVPFRKTSADAMASTATANVQIGWANPFDFSIELVSAIVIPVGGTLTAHDVDNAIITMKFDDGAAGTPAVAATWTTSTTGTGTWAVGIRKTAVLTAAGKILVAGGVAWFNIAKGGTGVIVPTSDYFMRFRRIGA